ncbi:enoyl-CoA hydratase/isomerase family protein [Arthrobacter sp. D1-29]
MIELPLRELMDSAPLRMIPDDGGIPMNPLVVINLDEATGDDVPAAVAALQAYPRPVVVGISNRIIPSDVLPIAEAMTIVLGPEESGRCSAGSPKDLDAIARTVERSPIAAVTYADVLRASEHVSFNQAIVTESLAYSTLLFGPEFLHWLHTRTVPTAVPGGDDPDWEPVQLQRSGDTLSVVLNDPERHNAFSSPMRAGLLNALAIAAADPALRVEISGAGASFCTGGDLTEFGLSTDPATAHMNRMRNHPGPAMHLVQSRTSVHVHGPLIGAGIEFAACAGHISAAPGSFFLLPELGYGQIPGAGGTVGIPRRIGRWRAAYMGLTRYRINVASGLRWGLIDDA